MNNNKAFTLVELIAIVVVISIISVISFTALTKNIKQSAANSNEIFKDNIYKAASLYISSNNLSNFKSGNKLYIDTTTLIEDEYLDPTIENKSGKDIYSYTVVASKNSDNEIVYSLTTKVDYAVLSNGKAYFDTSIEGAGDIKIVAEAAFSKDSGSDSYALYGARNEWKVNAYTFLPIYSGWFNLRPSYGSNEVLKSLSAVEGDTINNKYITIVQDKNNFKIDDLSYNINVSSSEQSFQTKSIYILGINDNGNPNLLLPSGNALKSFKIYKNNNLVRDYVPVIKGSTRYTDKPAPQNCLFDIVSMTYLEPSGGGVNVINADGGTIDEPTGDDDDTPPEEVIPDTSLVETNLNGADPELDYGMIPIYFDGTTIKKAYDQYQWYDSDNKKVMNWYDYSNKQWANAVYVKSSEFQRYKFAYAGTKIESSDILAYFVWIPRFKYKIFNPSNSVVTPQVIDVTFESGIAVSNGTTKGSYKTPPAFTYNNSTYNGYWIGKFELTGTTTDPTVLPNSNSMTNQTIASFYNISNAFTESKYNNMDTIRVMRVSDYAAPALLSASKYGISTDTTFNYVWPNANSNKITGCGASSLDISTSTTTCVNPFGDSSISYPQSTTGNITGVFDMAGGTYEIAMSFMANSTTTYTAYYDNKTLYASGFAGNKYPCTSKKDCGNDAITISGTTLPTYYEKMPLITDSYSTVCSGGLYEGYNICGFLGWGKTFNGYAAQYIEGPVMALGGSSQIDVTIGQSSVFTIGPAAGMAEDYVSTRMAINIEE